MEYFMLKLLPLFLVNFISFSYQDYVLLDNVFVKQSPVVVGDTLECLVKESNPAVSQLADTHVFTQSSSDASGYDFYPLGEGQRCFSFQIRGKVFPEILLSATPSVDQKLEVILQHTDYSAIRLPDGSNITKALSYGLVVDYEFRGFWIRWTDDQLLEVGRNYQNIPFLSAKIPTNIGAKYIGILSNGGNAEWVLHQDAKCGSYQVPDKIQTTSECRVVTQKNTDKWTVLQKQLEASLHQMLVQHEAYKLKTTKSKDTLLKYLRGIRKNYIAAREALKKIYVLDQDIYWPFKKTTFADITTIYLQFLEDIQMKLSSFLSTVEACPACPAPAPAPAPAPPAESSPPADSVFGPADL